MLRSRFPCVRIRHVIEWLYSQNPACTKAGMHHTKEGGYAMDCAFFGQWFLGFEEGLNEIDSEAREHLLKHCARRCADTGVLQSYLRLYQAVNGDRDAFYRRLSELGHVRGEVVVPGKEYRICFPECACDLHTSCGVNTPGLCECSRQSILYIAQSVWGDGQIRAEQVSTILSGDPECRFSVIFD